MNYIRIFMLIGMDASRAVKENKTGTEHYSEKIIYNIARLDSKNEFILYAPKKPKDGLLLNLPKNFKWKIITFPILWSQIRFSFEQLFGHPKPNVMFEPAHVIPIFHNKNTIVTLHDVAFKYYPEVYSSFQRFYYNWTMKFAVKYAKHIIAPSEFTKHDLIKFYNADQKKISVIYHGYNNELYKPESKKNINDKYIFFVGRLEEKKNVVNIIKTYKLLRQDANIKHKLILAGNPGYGYEKIKQEINNLPNDIKKDVIELGYIEEKTLSDYMKNADIFFFPSLFEGFGLPIIEACACGIPVVTSNTTSCKEIANDSATLVNPHNPNEMAKSLKKIISDDKLKEILKKKSLKNALNFSWKKSAQQHLDVMNKLI